MVRPTGSFELQGVKYLEDETDLSRLQPLFNCCPSEFWDKEWAMEASLLG